MEILALVLSRPRPQMLPPTPGRADASRTESPDPGRAAPSKGSDRPVKGASPGFLTRYLCVCVAVGQTLSVSQAVS